MMNPFLFAAIIFLGYFLESIFGLAGTILWLTAAGFFVDFRELIFLTTLTGISASACILLTDLKHVSQKRFLEIILPAIPGVILGVAVFAMLSSLVLLQIFAGFLILFSLYSLAFSNKTFCFPPLFRNVLLVISGIIHGIFGTGGPFAVAAMHGRFQNKSEFRSTLSLFFVLLGLFRFFQFWAQGSFSPKIFFPYWYLPIVIGLAVLLGHRVHVKISESIFQKGLAVLLLLCGIFFLHV